MTAPYFMRRTSAGYLAPDDDRAMLALLKVPIGSVVKVEIKTGRSVPMLRKWWALMTKIQENQSRYQTVEELEDALCVHLGHCERLVLRDGTEVRRPRSIAFHNMKQADFNDLYDRAIRMVCEHIIPGLEPGKLRDELEAFAL